MINNFRNIFKTTNKDKVKPKKDNQQNKKFTTSDLNEVTKVRPTLNKNGLAGLLGDITNLLSKKNEAIAEFIAAYLLVRISISIPRGNITLPFAAIKTVPRLNALLVLPTGLGKGNTEKLLNVIISLAEKLNNKKNIEQSIPLHARVHSGGLSTGEGIAFELRDESIDNKGNKDKGQKDKRLVIVEPEFANTLVKCNARNSILSGTIRKLFDGDQLEPLTKTDRTSCKEPHVGIVGHITPRELVLRLDDVSISNGFANRFPIFCGMAQELHPFPEVPCHEKMTELAKKLNDVLDWANEEERTLIVSNCYKELWINKYEYLKKLGAKDSIEQSLLTRAPHYTTMYAMLFATLEKSDKVTSKHLESALAWVEYWHESVVYIFDTEKEKAKAAENETLAQDVLLIIKNLINENDGEAITRTPLKQALGKRCNSTQLSNALQFLQELPLPPIKVKVGNHNRHLISLINNR